MNSTTDLAGHLAGLSKKYPSPATFTDDELALLLRCVQAAVHEQYMSIDDANLKAVLRKIRDCHGTEVFTYCGAASLLSQIDQDPV
jgi:hypothetical protein